MKELQKQRLTLLTFVVSILFTTGCAPKNSNGSYASAYSYHPYLSDLAVLEEKKVVYSTHNRSNNNYQTYLNTPPKPRRSIPSSFRPTNNLLNHIEETAKSLLGTDYKYGANGPYQYDCSSFTKYVFAKQGINIPRVSKDQAQRGQYVQARQLQKGDLVFFDSKKSEKVSHVGIYLGRGDFIHASSSQDKVTISNLSSNYYSKHFKWGRRVTNVNYAMK